LYFNREDFTELRSQGKCKDKVFWEMFTELQDVDGSMGQSSLADSEQKVVVTLQNLPQGLDHHQALAGKEGTTFFMKNMSSPKTPPLARVLTRVVGGPPPKVSHREARLLDSQPCS
jgi:hypothetical protein